MRTLQAHLTETYTNFSDKYSKTKKFAAVIQRHPFFEIPLAFADHICITLFQHFSDNLILEWRSRVKTSTEKGFGMEPILNYYSQQEIVNLYLLVGY